MNYNDERIKALEAQKQLDLTNQNSVYEGLLNENQALLDKQNSWQDTYLNNQNTLYDQGTNLAVNKLEQAKQDNNQAYQAEARASEMDYQNFINPYGTQAEQNAASGMTNTGYSESTKAAAYNTARNRTATARAAALKITADYENQIAQAKINNDSQKAALALELLKQKLANELSAYQTATSLKTTQLGMQNDLNNTYYNRYQDVFNQQKYEQEQSLAQKQYQEQLAYQKQKDLLAQQQWQREFDYNKQQDAIKNNQTWYSLKKSNSGSDGTILTNGGGTTLTNTQGTPMVSAGATEMLKQIQTYEKQHGILSKKQMTETLANWKKQGKITSNDVATILKQIYG